MYAAQVVLAGASPHGAVRSLVIQPCSVFSFFFSILLILSPGITSQEITCTQGLVSDGTQTKTILSVSFRILTKLSMRLTGVLHPWPHLMGHVEETQGAPLASQCILLTFRNVTYESVAAT